MQQFKRKKIESISAILLILSVLIFTLLSSCEGFNNGKNETFSIYKKSTEVQDAFQKEEIEEAQAQREDKQHYEEALVIRVIDGDTIVVLLNGREERVRLIGIDTPERGRPSFDEATQKTAHLVLGKKVRLTKDVSERDKYGRLLRYVYVGNLFVNAELVREGFAMVYTYPPDVKFSEYFLKLQQEARKQKRGLWGQETGIHKTESLVSYVASKKSNVFHLPDCTYAKKIAPSNLIKFNSKQEALNLGRRPCKVCNP